jgi:hypothetical protein
MRTTALTAADTLDWATRIEVALSELDALYQDEPTLSSACRGGALDASNCLGCPAALACLQRAVDNDDRTGVYGGLTGDERDALLYQPLAA